MDLEAVREQVAHLTELVAGLELKIEELEQQRADLGEQYQLLLTKNVVTEEVVHFAGKAHAAAVPSWARNLFLARDLPDEWWRRRKRNTLGDWWRELAVDTDEFRFEHGIGE